MVFWQDSLRGFGIPVVTSTSRLVLGLPLPAWAETLEL